MPAMGVGAPAAGVRWRIAYWLQRLTEVALVVLGLTWLLGPVEDQVADTAFLGGWLVLAGLYLLARWRALRPDRQLGTPDEWRRRLPGRRLGPWLTVTASLVGIAATANLVLVDRTNELQSTLRWLWVPAVAFSWLLLQFGYATTYARWYYEREPGCLRFPATEAPAMVDFTYFSMTLGTTFAASDVEVRSAALRYRVMSHSVIAFFFNVAVLAIAVGAVR